MARLSSVLSLRHLLVLSLAVNASLILRIMYHSEKAGPMQFTLDKSINPLIAGDYATQRRHLPVTPSSSSSSSSSVAGDGTDKVINLDHGDPTMYETFWRKMGDKSTIVIPGWQSMSYFSDVGNLCWFLEPEFAKEIVRLHKIVGNAVTEDRYIVVGTGSTQLFQAVLFAISPQDAVEPMNVVSAAPYYSSYPAITDCLKSGLYTWAGDAKEFNKDGPFIELVTSPNNPDGHSRGSVVNRAGGILVHDLAYYWPQYTPISFPADHDIMLFTVSKSTGHAGMRIGWALVKDREVAKKMVKFIELSTIGVSKDSQLRAARVLQVLSDSCEEPPIDIAESFFNAVYHVMAARWKLLRAAAKQSGLFSLPEFTPAYCKFLNQFFEPQPAFAWLKCEDPIEDCEEFLRFNKILTRSGRQFGVGPQYVRISLLDREENFNLFVQRLSNIHLEEESVHTG